EQVYIESPSTGVYQVFISSSSSAMDVTAAIVVTCDGSVTSEPTHFYVDDTLNADVELHTPLEPTVPSTKSPNLRISASASSAPVRDAHENSADEHAVDVIPPAESAAPLGTSSNGQAAYEQIHSVTSESMLPASASYSRTETIPVKENVAPMMEKCIATYTTTAPTDQLYSVTMDLNAEYHGGSAAFILAIVVYAPNEEILQIGGYQNYLTSRRLWN
ncbi:unnamed protein product, partial [Symbiodinium microadriaticum]